MRRLSRALAALADAYIRFIDWVAGAERPDPIPAPAMMLTPWARAWVDATLADIRSRNGLDDGIVATVQRWAEGR